jgi:hypothetical protein
MENLVMFIILTGGPVKGFTACGPCATEEEAGSEALCTYGGQDWFVFPLRRVAPFLPPGRTAKEWRESGEKLWVRFAAGGLDEQWKFTGPHDQGHPGDDPMRMLQLMPLEQEDAEPDDDELSERIGAS